ncbi:MAG: PhoU domain-containing protein [Lawsonibacter sp.]
MHEAAAAAAAGGRAICALISSALKMISDMERIGDQAADIAEITALSAQGSMAISQVPHRRDGPRRPSRW